ncbi:MAG TPA: cytochrome P450 [Planctomycetaceae bacterium]|nr:cytochrome P450 [Planctomycetaceae bacterium]
MTVATLPLNDVAPQLPVTQGDFLTFPDDPIACMQRLHRDHGLIGALEQNGTRIHFVFGPDYNHQVLSDAQTYHSRFFAVRGPKNSPQRRLTSGLLSMNGEQHKHNRRLVMDAFLKKAIQGYLPTLKTLCDSMLADWQPGQERDISRDMTEFLLRLTSLILFGTADSDLAYRIGRMIDQWVHLNHEIGMGALVAHPQFADRYEVLLDLSRELEEQIAGLIQQRRQSSGHGCDALSMMLAANDDQGRMSDEELIGQTALIFAAAHLTTAHSLTWTLFLLAQHPGVMSRLHQQFQSQLTGGYPTMEEIDRVPLMEYVIKESMRVLPASAYSQRIVAQPTRLGPFDLPAGAGVVFSQYITHHLPELFPDPDAFLPDRWATISPSPYAYLPYGAGSRMCLGGPLAMVILKTVPAAILQRFKLTMVPGSEVTGNVISTMLSPTQPVRMRINAQDGRFESQPVTGNIGSLVDLREVASPFRRAA